MARRRRSRLKGAAQVRSLLKRMPEAVHAEIVAIYRAAEAPALAIARAGTPVRTGALRNALRARVLPRSLRFQVGLIGKPANRQFFYGRILEIGRKAQTVKARRRNASGGVTTYAMRVSAIPGVRFNMVQGPARAQIRQLIVDPIRNLWEKSLRRAALGASDE